MKREAEGPGDHPGREKWSPGPFYPMCWKIKMSRIFTANTAARAGRSLRSSNSIPSGDIVRREREGYAARGRTPEL